MSGTRTLVCLCAVCSTLIIASGHGADIGAVISAVANAIGDLLLGAVMVFFFVLLLSGL